MQIKTAIKSGSIASDAASLGCQALNTGAYVYNSADLQANKLADAVTGTTQTAWNSVKSWLGLS